MNLEIANMALNIGNNSAPTWTDIGALITSVSLTILTIINIAMYNKFSKYDFLLKEELTRLIEFKNKYIRTENAINWFLHNLLAKTHNYGYHLSKPPIIKRNDIIKNYNIICELNNFYNDYQYIFRKYKLEKDIELITSLLDIIRFLADKDIELKLISKPYINNGDIEKYMLPQIGQIGGIFMTSAYTILHPVIFPDKWYEYFIMKNETKNKIFREKINKQIREMCKLGTVENYEKIKNEVSQRLSLLLFKLEHICMFPMHKIPQNLQIRQKKYYSKIDQGGIYDL